ncbi:hypothetical protein AK830_g4299 [Neonectria ditissima]|uniref:Uncharacterized protein n=1 Tax=Neonectria ditissima TaxID=78410 RepID=A0A0P7BPA4_9HYPO|nr:hypothetical protein AK830_g4299 [Neonectria ditissima]
MDPARSKVVEDNPMGIGLKAFRALSNSIDKGSISYLPDTINLLGDKYLRRLSPNLLVALQNLPTADLVTSSMGRGTVEADLLKLLSTVTSDNFTFDRIKPLLQGALADKPQDTLIWDLASTAAIESTPSPRPYLTVSIPAMKATERIE